MLVMTKSVFCSPFLMAKNFTNIFRFHLQNSRLKSVGVSGLGKNNVQHFHGKQTLPMNIYQKSSFPLEMRLLWKVLR